jgi:predicted nucleic acid-binding protein
VIVVDTNVVVPLVIEGPRSIVVERCYEMESVWCAPIIWRHELRNVLVRHCRAGVVDWSIAAALVADAELQLSETDHHVESDAVLRFARRSGCSAYDAEFGVLAEGLGLPLLTWDGKLLAALPGRAVTPEEFLARR